MGFVYEDIRYEITRNDALFGSFPRKGPRKAVYWSLSRWRSTLHRATSRLQSCWAGWLWSARFRPEPFSILASIFDDEVCCVVGPCERRRSQVHKRDHAICFPAARVICAGATSFSPMFMNVFCTASFVLEAESLFGEFSGAEFSGGKCDGLFGCAPNGVRLFSVCGERYSLRGV